MIWIFHKYSCRYRAPQILQLENLEDLINEGKIKSSKRSNAFFFPNKKRQPI